MSKLKTHKMTAKRVKITRPKKGKSAKILTKPCGQAHFNARENGKTKRLKRRAHHLSDAHHRTIIRLISN